MPGDDSFHRISAVEFVNVGTITVDSLNVTGGLNVNDHTLSNIYFDDSLMAFETINIVDFSQTRQVYIGPFNTGSPYGVQEITSMSDSTQQQLVLSNGSIHIGRLNAFNTNSNLITIGCQAAQGLRGSGGISIGAGTAKTAQGANAIALGTNAGGYQNNYAISIGENAGLYQDASAIAIGRTSGNSQGLRSIAIGFQSGHSQANSTIAIGSNAGITQGPNSIAIGISTSSNTGSIVLNASGSSFASQVDNAFYVKPVREQHVYAKALGYSSDGEILQSQDLIFPGHVLANVSLQTSVVPFSNIIVASNVVTDIGGRFDLTVEGDFETIDTGPVYGLANVVFGTSYTDTPVVVVTPGNLETSQLAPFVQVYPGYFQVCTGSPSATGPLKINYTVLGLF